MKRFKRKIAAVLTFAVLLAGFAAPAAAKTASSEKADNVFFYAENAEGKSVLLKVMTLEELKKLAHGQADGNNYWFSGTDNYPAAQYCEGRGFTVNELVEYVKSKSSVNGVESIRFSGKDALKLMATDSYGNYSRSYTCEDLYGVKRYYFEGLYDEKKGWNTGWEAGGGDGSKYGLTLEEYNSVYKNNDPYYANKRSVFQNGLEMPVILAAESYSGRTAGQTLISSTEPGIASYIKANGGIAAGSLKHVITDDYVLRLCIPMTEADLMAAHRTAYDNFKWIYNMRLDMVNAPRIQSLGTVVEPVPSFSLNGDKLTVSFSCATAGASVYYGFEGAAQTLYTAPVTIDVAGRNLESDPVTVYAAAVKEGYDDAGVLMYKYPGIAPAFKTVYSGMSGESLTFSAADHVSSADWNAWTAAVNFITMKAPSESGYTAVNRTKYRINRNEKSITFDSSLFTETGSYSFVFHATKYADKRVSAVMKKAAPALSAADSFVFGQAITVRFGDTGYSDGLSVYVSDGNGKRTMISSGYLDRTQKGQASVKPEYFTANSSGISGAGVYTLEFVNNSYSPSSQTVKITLTGGYTDVPANAWYYTYVTELSESGVINGMGNGRFAPQGTVTWGQALKLLMLAAGYEEQAKTSAHWASGYLTRAAEDGLTGYSGSLDAAISRLDFCKAAAKALKAETALTVSPFADTNDTDVLALNELGIINGMADGRFAPANTLTRAEISKIIWCIQNLGEEGKQK